MKKKLKRRLFLVRVKTDSMLSNWRGLAAIGILWAFFPVCSIAANPSEFEYTARLQIPAESGQAFSAKLSLDALCRISSASQMRIFSTGSKEVPFTLRRRDGDALRVSRPVALFNQLTSPGVSQQFDFVLPPEVLQLSEIVLYPEQKNYSMEAEIYGKETETGEFQLIRAGIRLVGAYSEKDSLKFQHNRLVFPVQRVRFFRVVLKLLGGEFPLSLTRVEAISEEKKAQERFSALLGLQPLKPEEAEKFLSSYYLGKEQIEKKQFYLLTPPCADLGIDQLSVRMAGENFFRRAALYSVTADKPQLARMLASTMLFKYSNDQHLTLDFPPGSHSRLLLEVSHGDDQQIPVVRVEGSLFTREVMFLAERTLYPLPYNLYYGTANPAAPVYDIEQRLTHMPRKDFALVALGESMKNPLYRPVDLRPVSERVPYLITIAVILLGLVLLLYLKKLLSEGAPGKTDQ